MKLSDHALFAIAGALAGAGIVASIAMGGGDTAPTPATGGYEATGNTQAAPALASCNAACAAATRSGMSIAVLSSSSQ
jgi:hypothetical protein